MTNPTPERPLSFYQPRENDPRVQEMLTKLGLRPDASLAHVEKTAKALFYDGGAPVGVSLVMGREVSPSETELLGVVLSTLDTAASFNTLLELRAAEIQARAQQKK